jgi:ERF superfamily
MSDLPAPPDQTLSQWDRFLRDPQIDVEKLKALFELHERAEARTAKAAFNAGFAAMQGELPTIDENGAAVMNGQRRYTYAAQEDIIQVVKPILQKYGFALRFRHEYHDGLIRIIGILSHRDGHQEQDEFECPADTSGSKNAIQAVGSTRTYGQRYTTRALLNIVSRDPRDPARDTDGHRTPTPIAGYVEWATQMEATAEKGIISLRQAWREALPAHRDAMPPETRERLKAKATAVTAQRSA